ncbi:bis(5'-nucleosyl)-tetraphosphatase [Chlamydiota bacterium]
MNSDHSYGIVPLRRVGEEWEVLLVKHSSGHWSFPKGHADPGEEPHSAAIRELQEETGMEVVRFLETFPMEEKYKFRWQGQLIDKTVLYFPAEVHGEVVIQAEEISDFKWVSLYGAEKLATFPATKQMCVAVHNILDKV